MGTRIFTWLPLRLEFILNVHQSVVLGHSLAPSGSARLEMSRSQSDGQVRDEVRGVFRGTMGDEDVPSNLGA